MSRSATCVIALALTAGCSHVAEDKPAPLRLSSPPESPQLMFVRQMPRLPPKYTRSHDSAVTNAPRFGASRLVRATW